MSGSLFSTPRNYSWKWGRPKRFGSSVLQDSGFQTVFSGVPGCCRDTSVEALQEWEGAATTLVSSSFPLEPEELILSCLLFWEEEGSRNNSLEITGAVT